MKIIKQLIFNNEEIDLVEDLFTISNDQLKELGFSQEKINKIWLLWQEAFNND